MTESSGNLATDAVTIATTTAAGVPVTKTDDPMGGFNKFTHYSLKYRNMFNSSINEN